MIQVQIPDNEEVFNELKRYSTYYSKLTGVIELPDSYRGKVPPIYKIHQKLDEEEQLKIGWDGKTNFLVDGVMDESTRLFLGLYNGWQSEVSIKDINKIYVLLKMGGAEQDTSFAELFTPLNDNATVGDLVYAKRSRWCSGRFVDVKPYKGLSLKEICTGTTKQVDEEYYSKMCTVVSVIPDMTNGKGQEHTEILMQYEDDNGSLSDAVADLYCMKTTIIEAIKPGHKLNCMLYKRINRKGELVTSSVGFLPKWLECNRTTPQPPKAFREAMKVWPVGKRMPVEAFRAIYYEWLIRTVCV